MSIPQSIASLYFQDIVLPYLLNCGLFGALYALYLASSAKTCCHTAAMFIYSPQITGITRFKAHRIFQQRGTHPRTPPTFLQELHVTVTYCCTIVLNVKMINRTLSVFSLQVKPLEWEKFWLWCDIFTTYFSEPQLNWLYALSYRLYENSLKQFMTATYMVFNNSYFSVGSRKCMHEKKSSKFLITWY